MYCHSVSVISPCWYFTVFSVRPANSRQYIIHHFVMLLIHLAMRRQKSQLCPLIPDTNHISLSDIGGLSHVKRKMLFCLFVALIGCCTVQLRRCAGGHLMPMPMSIRLWGGHLWVRAIYSKYNCHYLVAAPVLKMASPGNANINFFALQMHFDTCPLMRPFEYERSIALLKTLHLPSLSCDYLRKTQARGSKLIFDLGLGLPLVMGRTLFCCDTHRDLWRTFS